MRLFLPMLILILLTASLVSINAFPISGYAESNARISYDISVDEVGLARIVITVHALLKNFYGWLFVPKYTNYTINGANFKILCINESYYTFYYNLSFYIFNEGMINVTWKMMYASLIVGENAYFLSPPINVLPHAETNITVVLKGSLPTYINPPTNRVSERYNNTIILYYSKTSPSTIFRIEVEYSVKNQKNIERNIWKLPGGTKLIIEAPSYYTAIALKVYHIYREVYPILADIIQTNLSYIKVKFFAPKHDEVNILGYVPIEHVKPIDTVMLNPFWIRSLPGAIEQGAVHELIHILLFNKGLDAEHFLWLHEGLAEYLSLSLLEKYPETKEWCKEKINEYMNENPNCATLFSWRPGEIHPWLYCCAYRLMRNLVGENITKLKRFFSLLPNFKNVTNNEEIIALFNIAGLNVTAFKDMKLPVDWGLVRFYEDYYRKRATNVNPRAIIINKMLIIIGILFAIFLITLFVLTYRIRRRYRETLILYNPLASRSPIG